MSREQRAHAARHLHQHEVALLVAVGVVHLLEVVDVEHGQARRAVEAAAAVHLVLEEVLEVAHVEEAGELVRDRLALHRLVQGRVLDRHRCLRRQVAEQVASRSL